MKSALPSGCESDESVVSGCPVGNAPRFETSEQKIKGKVIRVEKTV